jgi:hypothetical protein
VFGAEANFDNILDYFEFSMDQMDLQPKLLTTIFELGAGSAAEVKIPFKF